MGMITTTVILYHGGHFRRDPNGDVLEYFKGEFCVWEDIHIDYLNKSILEATLGKCQKYFSIESIW